MCKLIRFTIAALTQTIMLLMFLITAPIMLLFVGLFLGVAITFAVIDDCWSDYPLFKPSR